jgi:hypothetical protein
MFTMPFVAALAKVGLALAGLTQQARMQKTVAHRKTWPGNDGAVRWPVGLRFTGDNLP